MSGTQADVTAPMSNVEPRSPYEAHIAKVVAAAPPLTVEQEARIRGLFRPGAASLPALPLAA
ncbi:hypothetical protein [Streptomyces erythrochromogenes]|uniref:hypothetical protein n=1 Tax=Streptomyces erythrochromogenes TaxID=285574 RepID=UPI00224E0583|nr:hypothetical protein [Streptomyces erythrochromogenes]MCX5587612.1 hypothetical protein [Streptomyces erythrochromogenes]